MIRLPPRSPLFPSTTLFLSYMKPADVRHRIAFSELGLDSILLVELAKSLSTHFGHPVRAVDLYDNSNVEALSDRKSTRLNSSHANISYAVFCLKKNKHNILQ